MIYCPFLKENNPNAAIDFVICLNEVCALWVGNECAFRAMGRAAQQQITDANFAETVALYRPVGE